MPILADSGRKSTGAAWMKVGDRIKLLSGITVEIVRRWDSLGVQLPIYAVMKKAAGRLPFGLVV